MEIECDLGSINDENLLRKMWQQSEDLGRKKEIRSHLYKLRESRLKDFYLSGGDIMSGMASFGKNPLTTSHGDSLADQSFESLKSKEIRDSQSPTHDMRFRTIALTNPDTSGWDVQSSSEIAPDGRAFRSDTSAKTGGIEKINGGSAEFQGHSEHHASGSYQGDDKNFVKKAGESSKTQLQEKVVIGDENSGLTEINKSSTSSSSKSEYISSSMSTDPDRRPITMNYAQDKDYNRKMQTHQQQQEYEQYEQSQYSSVNKEQYQQKQQKNANFDEENKRFEKMDKNSPEYQQRVQFLMAQQGEIVSNTVEYVKPNVKMITTVKRLPDGTIVKTKNYETDDKSSRHHSVQDGRRTHETRDSSRYQVRAADDVDSVYHDQHPNSKSHSYEVETSEEIQTHSQMKTNKSQDFTTHGFPSVRADTPTRDLKSRGFQPNRDSTPRKTQPNEDFTTHGFPSVRAGTPTRDAPPRKPQTTGDRTPKKSQQPHDDFTTHGFPSVISDVPTREFVNERAHQIREEYTESEITKTSVESKKNSRRDDQQNTVKKGNISPRKHRPEDDFTTHGFPSVRPDRPTQEFPSERAHSRHEEYHDTETDGQQVLVKKASEMSAKHKATAESTALKEEYIVEHEEDYSTEKYSHGTYSNLPSTPTTRKARPAEDFSTHGFPSVRADRPTQEFPTDRPHSRQEEYKETQSVSIQIENRQKSVPQHVQGREDFMAENVEVTDSRRSKNPDEDVPQIFYGDSTPHRDQPKSSSTRKPRPVEDFSTHGFPSVRPDRPTQEFPTEKIHAAHKKTAESTVRKEEYIVEHEADFSTEKYSHGTYRNLPSGPSPRKLRPTEDFSTHGFPSVRPDRPTQEFPTDRPHSRQEEHQEITMDNRHSETQKSVLHTRGKEDFTSEDIEVTDSRRSKNPDEDVPQMFYADLSPRKSQPKKDFSTNGFPSVKTTTSTKEMKTKTSKSDFSTNGFPSVKAPTASAQQRRPSNDAQLDDTSSVKSHGSVDVSVRRETKVDAAHQAFASSLRCSSPADGTRRDSHSYEYKNQTPRTSVGSVKSTVRRDVRSPSRESYSPSEGSRISTSTVTKQATGRHTPHSDTKRSSIVSKQQTVVKTTKTTTNVPVTSATAKSPITKKPTTTGVTSSSPIDTKKTTSTAAHKADSLITKPTKQFPINEPLTTITKNTFNTESAAGFLGNEVVEEPIIKKSYYRVGPSANQPRSLEKPSPHSPLYRNRSPETQNTTFTQNTENNMKTISHIDKSKMELETTKTEWQLDKHNKRAHYSEDELTEQVAHDKPTHVPFKHQKSPSPIRRKSVSPNRTSHPDSSPNNKESEMESPYQTDNETNYDETVDTMSSTKNELTQSSTVRETFSAPKQRDDIPRKPNPSGPITAAQPNYESLTKISDDKQFDVDSAKHQFSTTTQSTNLRNVTDGFLTTEREDNRPSVETKFAEDKKPRDESDDTVRKPITRKSVLQRSETYEERCRQILGMEHDEDQPKKGNKKPKTNEDEESDFDDSKPRSHSPEKGPSSISVVEIEDCTDDNEYENNVTKTFKKRPDIYETAKPKPESVKQNGNYVGETSHKVKEVTTSIHRRTGSPNKPQRNPQPTEPDGLSFSKRSPDEEAAPITDDIIFETFTTPAGANGERPKVKDIKSFNEPELEIYCENDLSKEEVAFSEKTIILDVSRRDSHKSRGDRRKSSPSEKPILKQSPTRKSPSKDGPKDSNRNPEKLEPKQKPSPEKYTKYPEATEKSFSPKKNECPKKEPRSHGPERKPSPDRKQSPTSKHPNPEKPNRRESNSKTYHSEDFIEPKTDLPRKPFSTGKFDYENTTQTRSERRTISDRSVSPNLQKSTPTNFRSPLRQTDTHHVEEVYQMEQFHDHERTEETHKSTATPRRSITSPSRKPNKHSEPEKQKTVKSMTTSITKQQQQQSPPRKPSVTTTTSPTRRPSSSLIEHEKRLTTKSSRIIGKQNIPAETPRKPSIGTTSSPSKTTRRPAQVVTKSVQSSQTSLNSSPYHRSPERHTDYYSSSSSVHQTDSKGTHISSVLFQVSPPVSPLKNDSKPLGKGTTRTTTTTTTTRTSARKDFPDFSPIQDKKKKFLVTDRKESAPVHRVTKKDRDLQKVSRSTSEHITSIRTEAKRPVTSEAPDGPKSPGVGRPSSRTERRPSKCLTTKTINLTSANRIINSEDMENVVIDIQQAKSSREHSPNKIVPTPVSHDLYTGKPRYPDVVQEPEDEPRKKPTIQNIPIFEEETNEYVGCQITEVNIDKNVKKFTDKVDYTQEEEETIIMKPEVVISSGNYFSIDKSVDDDCLLSVHDKVSKFIHTAEEVKKPKASGPFRRDYTPTPEVPKDDECLLSVDEKVTKFTKSADSNSPSYVQRPIKPNDDRQSSVSERSNKFTATASKLEPTTPQRSPELVAKIEKQMSRQGEVKDEPEYTEDDDKEVIMRTTTSNQYNLANRDIGERSANWEKDILSRPSVWDKNKKPGTKQSGGPAKLNEPLKRSDYEEDEDQNIEYGTKINKTSSSLYDSTTSNTARRSSKSPSPTRRQFDKKPLSPVKPTTKDEGQKLTTKSSYVSTSISSTENHNNISFDSQNEENFKTLLSENSPRPNKKPILRPSDFSPESPRSPLKSKLTTESVAVRRNLFERGGDVSPRPGSTTPTTPTPTGRRPSYMDHTKSSLEHTRRDSIELTKNNYSRKSSTDDSNAQYIDSTTTVNSTVKFNVEPKRRDTPTAQVKKRTSSSEIPHIEEIFDLELLEKMLNVVTSYEQRRRIRAQIRLVKKTQQTQQQQQSHQTTKIIKTNTTTVTSTGSRKPSTDHTDARKFSTGNSTKTTTSTNTTPNPRLSSVLSSAQRRQQEQTQEDLEEVDCSTTECYHHEVKISSEKSHSPTRKTSDAANKFEVKKVSSKLQTSTTSKERKDSAGANQPIWINRKNVLKSEKLAPVAAVKKHPQPTEQKANNNGGGRSTTTSTRSAQQQSTTTTHRQQRTPADEDSITSSYGIGPTDENGLPLFGIRALKKKSHPGETSKVTGMVVTEKYYSDNKTKPTVERKETIYSTDAEELQTIEQQLDLENRKSSDERNVIRKFKKIEKYPYDDEPSSEPAIMDNDGADEFSSTQTTSSTKVVRRGSVKEMSEKFIRKESQSQSVNEKTNSAGGYPKAGLILRTSTNSGATADTADNYETRSKRKTTTKNNYNDDTDLELDECEIEEIRRSSRKYSRVVTESESENESVQIHRKVNKSTRSFLNSVDSKVTGVDDVLERMRNADNVIEDGDTQDDREARALLNKFLGASVIMSGIETVLPQNQMKANADSGDAMKQEHQVKTTLVTQTIKTGNSSSPVAKETCDFEEIWDEKLLKELLEKSTTYEERRKIRARLRQLMAEREASTEVTASDKVELEKNQIIEKEEKFEKTPPLQDDNQESSGSEYEEIIEEITDSEEDEEDDEKEKANNKVENASLVKEIEKDNATENEIVEETNTTEKTETSQQTINEDTAKGESLQLIPLLHDLLQLNMPQVFTHSKAIDQNSQKLKLKNAANTKQNSSRASSNNSCNNCSESSSKVSPPRTQADNKSKTQIATDDSDATIAKCNCTSVEVTATVVDSKLKNPKLNSPHIEDSGTESGEDLRLIAAGLTDSMQMQKGTNVIAEVTAALTRLENSLKEGKDISLDDVKRRALLALVNRLQTGLTSPEKLAEAAAMAQQCDLVGGNNHDDTSSPEAADTHKSNRQRFAKRRNRNNRHTVGVSREELADARRFMEDMLMIENFSNCTTPESTGPRTTPPQWFPIEKNFSAAAVSGQQPYSLCRPNQFVANIMKSSTQSGVSEVQPDIVDFKKEDENMNRKSKRPLSGDFSVTFNMNNSTDINNKNVGEKNNEPISDYSMEQFNNSYQYNNNNNDDNRKSFVISPEILRSNNRFTNKKQLMKRANTIDIPKTKKYNPEFDTDSEMEDRAVSFGLKRAIQVSVKNKVKNIVPQFEPKTENDHKFLAFINKQSSTPGLGWTSSKSVTNWSNKFGNIKNSFECGNGVPAGKPPVPSHNNNNLSARNFWNKQAKGEQQQQMYQSKTQQPTNLQEAVHQQQQQQQRFQEKQQNQQRQEYQPQQNQQQQQHRFQEQQQKQEYQQQEIADRQRQFEQRKVSQTARQIERENKSSTEREKPPGNLAQYKIPTTPLVKPMPVNKFIHAQRSAFRPIETSPPVPKENIFQPISTSPQETGKILNYGRHHQKTTNQHYNQEHLNSSKSWAGAFSTSSNTTSPIGRPWIAKPTSGNSAIKKTVNKFENSIQQNNSSVSIERHNSLRDSNSDPSRIGTNQKRPSLPNATDTHLLSQYANPLSPPQMAHYGDFSTMTLPPPLNISYRYADSTPKPPKVHYQSYPRFARQDSLTNPQAEPLILTTNRPTYSPSNDLQWSNVQNKSENNDYGEQMQMITPATKMETGNDFSSDNSMMEYKVEAKVMGKPLSQQAVTIGSRTNHINDEDEFGKHSRAAKDLLTAMKNISSNSEKNYIASVAVPEVRGHNSVSASLSPQAFGHSPDGRLYQAPVVEPIFSPKFEINRAPLYIGSDFTEPPPNTSPYNFSKLHHTHDIEVKNNDGNFQNLQIVSNASEDTSGYNSAKLSTAPNTPDEVSKEIMSPRDSGTYMNLQEIQTFENLNNQERRKSLGYSLPAEATPLIRNLIYSPPAERTNFQQYIQSDSDVYLRKKPSQDTSMIYYRNAKEEQQMENRRKSYGAVLDMKQRHSVYLDQSFKSAAPMDTPDIVKSSLPKDETQPIMKKFGPPQRHLYQPNAYQNPMTNANSLTKNVGDLRLNTNLRQSLINPIIVETPATPIARNEESIPRNIVFNNVNAFTSMSARIHDMRSMPQQHTLSKSDSWNNICRQQQNNFTPSAVAPSAKFNNSTTLLRRTKSGHSLAVPKMYEAGISKAELSEKQKTVAAYFSGKKSPAGEQEQEQNTRANTTIYTTPVKKSTINRTKTSQKISTSSRYYPSSSSSLNISSSSKVDEVMGSTVVVSNGLTRSQTMPHIANLKLLDESNVEDAFEQLMSGS